ncbi:MAG TPA: ABC transporter permease subunit, partial [Planctomycetota bacterium]|nr:ABC transporter permease subunit [Planctomycetota bacterium]
WLESAFFLGDFRAWLAPPRAGSGAPFWAGLFLLPSLLVTLFAYRRWVLPRLLRKPTRLPPWREALRDLVRGVPILAASIIVASAAALLLEALGVDPRDSLVGTYVQRNTLIVGFVMGFAVIPIIYTIAEDALSSVPEHLRGAALGCGATPWQAAVRVILPTAASGIFSAVMIGLGRAVGETMIVVMAAGNTPIMDVNPFNGLRALSATIAVELPEAVKDGTLYRMLFLAALTLFLITFVVNTAAELVRMRFRKKAFEL